MKELTLFNNNYKKYYSSLLFITVLLMADSAFAADTATELAPMLTKILGSLSGTLGKVIMAVGLLLSGIAGLAGMNKAVILTPVGVGFLLGNSSSIISWMLG